MIIQVPAEMEHSYEVSGFALMGEDACYEGDPNFAWTVKSQPSDDDVRDRVRTSIPLVYEKVAEIHYRVGNGQLRRITPN